LEQLSKELERTKEINQEIQSRNENLQTNVRQLTAEKNNLQEEFALHKANVVREIRAVERSLDFSNTSHKEGKENQKTSN
jgi:hypothetical protein